MRLILILSSSFLSVSASIGVSAASRRLGRLAITLGALFALTGCAAAGEDSEGEEVGAGSIVGGRQAQAGSAPWQVEIYSTNPYTPEEIAADKALANDDPKKRFLYKRQSWDLDHRCGGVLIGDDWVLTAAHCVVLAGLGRNPLTERRVRIGTQDLTKGGATYRIERVAVHRGHDPVAHVNDIALLKIAADGQTRASEGRSSRPIPLLGDASDDRPVAPFDRVSVTGWGVTKARNSGEKLWARDGTLLKSSPVLMKVSLSVVSADRCEQVPAYRGFVIGKGVICAGSTEPETDSCGGDSGGPLTRTEGSKEVLVGLVAWGHGCGLEGVPGIYTDVSAHKAWIATTRRMAPAGKVVRL